MDWKSWERQKAGEAKLSVEEAEQYVTELILSRSIPQPLRNDKKAFQCTPAALQSISRSRRVMLTLGMIVKSRHLEYYYQAIYLLQFLYSLYPNAILVKDYGKLLVYLKVEAVIYVACCSVSVDRAQAVQHLMKQLFDNYDCESCSAADKQHLDDAHDEGCIKLNQILAAVDDKLLLTQLSAEQHHKSMCEILEGFFKGIDDELPRPAIIQIIEDLQRSVQATTSTNNLSSSCNLPTTSTKVPVKGKSPFISSTGTSKGKGPSKSKMAGTKETETTADLPITDKITAPTERSSVITTTCNTPCKITKFSNTIALVKVISPPKPSGSSEVVAAVNKSQDDTSKTVMSHDSNDRSKIVDHSTENTAASPQTINLPMTTEDDSDSNDNTDDANTSLKFVPTHSHIKRIPLPAKRFVPSLKCRKNLTRPNGKSDHDCGKTQPKIKSVRIILSPLTMEECMHHNKQTSVQQKELPHKESRTEPVPGSVHTSSDEDYQPPSDLEDVIGTLTRMQRKRKASTTRYTQFLEDRRYRRDNDNQKQTHTPESENTDKVSTVVRAKKKRKSVVPPVRYAPFAGTRNQLRVPENCNSEQSHTSDSEYVISESVATSSIDSDPPLANLC